MDAWKRAIKLEFNLTLFVRFVQCSRPHGWARCFILSRGTVEANNGQDLVFRPFTLLVNGCNDTMANKIFNGDEWENDERGK